MLDATPAECRATPAEEREMLRWAGHGVTRVTHVLNATNTRVLTFEQLCTHYPDLVGRGSTRACVKRMFGSIRDNLHRWQYTLADGPQPEIQQGQFRHTQTGQLLRARQTAQAGDATVPAWVCETEPQTGAIRVTDEPATRSQRTPRRASSARRSASCALTPKKQTTTILLQAKRRKAPNTVAWPQYSHRRREPSVTQRSAPEVHPRFQTLEC